MANACIFSIAQFYHENEGWLFSGVFRVLRRHEDRYEVELQNIGNGFIGRLKLHSDYRGRTTRANFENHYERGPRLRTLKTLVRRAGIEPAQSLRTEGF